MQKTCTQCSASFEITDDDLAFYDKMSPVFGGKKYAIPPPTLCPADRHRRRLTFRNLRHIHKTKSALSGAPTLSCFPKESGYTVYSVQDWWSDGWDAMEHGRDFDFSRPFFDQFFELFKEVPQLALYQLNNENCDYINGAANCRNCYLLFNADYCEDVYYSSDATHNKTCLDCSVIKHSERCYECIECHNCYQLQHSIRCENCNESAYLQDCKRCSHCIGCSNLVDKEYHLFNEPCSKERYEEVMKELEHSSYHADCSARCTKLFQENPKKYYTGHQNENSTGDALYKTKNCFHCFECEETEDCSYCSYLFRANNCRDYDIFGDSSEWIYECMAHGFGCSSNSFCVGGWNSTSNNFYCATFSNIQHCFGCVGLKNKKYCIFNKQYEKDEYEELVPRIIKHMQSTEEWGEFFPTVYSPYSYNQTYAHEYFPMTKEEVHEKGWKWADQKDDVPTVEKMIPAEKLPNFISSVPDDILNWAIICKETKRPFKIIKQELEFYRQLNIPIPHFHPDERHRRRMAQRNPRKLWERQCDKCQREIQTTYQPSRPEIVYCEECYLQSVY